MLGFIKRLFSSLFSSFDYVWVTYTYPGNDNIVCVNPHKTLESAAKEIEHHIRCYGYGVKSIIARDTFKRVVGIYEFELKKFKDICILTRKREV